MLGTLKAIVKAVPVLGPWLVRLRGAPAGFKTSSDYWDRRYRAGGTSGAGSYDRLAEFKADFLNRFVAEHQIGSVIEFGSGDGAQLQRARYPSYLGVDISATAVARCRALFADDATKRFLQPDAVPPGTTAELALSLDVIYHLVEDPVFEAYMRQLFGAAVRFVIIYSSDMDQAWTAEHVRHRRFTQWVAQNMPGWRLQATIKNAYPYDAADPDRTSFADFHVFAPA